jgi:hypothetical protein
LILTSGALAPEVRNEERDQEDAGQDRSLGV